MSTGIPIEVVADETIIHDNVENEIAAITPKATPVGADHVLIEDSEASNAKKSTTSAAIAASGPPQAHAVAGGDHTASTLASLNTKVSDATLDDSGDSRPPSGAAGGSLTGTFPNPGVADGADGTAVHVDGSSEFGGITDDPTPPSTGRLIAETSAGVKFRVDIGNLPTGGGGESNTGSNTGADGVGVFDVKSGIDLQFRNVAPASSKISVALNSKDIDLDVVPGNIAHQDLSGAGTNTHAQIDTHIADTANPHGTDIANLGAGTLAELNTTVSDATLDDSGDSRTPSGSAGGDLGGTYPNPTVNDGADSTAIHDNVASEISAITEKVTPVAGDFLLIEDSAAANVKKRVQVGNLPSGAADHGALTGLGDDDHTQYQLRSEENAASGYAGLDGSSKLTGSQQVYGTGSDTAAEGNDSRLSDARTPTGTAGGDLNGTYPNPGVDDGADGSAIHDDTAGEIIAVTLKATPGGTDVVLIEDVAAANVKKRTTAAAIAASGPPAAHTHTHASTTGQTADDHHNQSHAFAGGDHTASTLATVNTKISDATLDDAGDSRPPSGTAGGSLNGTYPNPGVDDGADGSAIHDDTAGEILAITLKAAPVGADVLIIEDTEAANAKKHTTAAAIAASGPPAAHTHTHASTTGQTADDHHNQSHAFAGGDHTTSTLANVNTKISDATLDDAGDSRPPSGTAGGDLNGTYPNPGVDDGADGSAIHDNVASEISVITEKVTPIAGDFLVIEDSAAGNVKKRVQVGNLPGGSGTDDDAIHDNVANEISAIADKASPVGADIIIIEDSAAGFVKKKVTITNLPGGADADAIHDNVAAEISAITEKVTPISGDFLLIEDSAAANVKKRIQVGNLPGGGVTEFADDVFRIQDNGDATKEIAFQASGITTGTTRTITVPDESITIDGNADTRPPEGAAGGEVWHPPIINAAATGVVNVDFSAGNAFRLDVTGNITSLTATAPNNGWTGWIRIEPDASGRTIVWTVAIRWINGIEPPVSALLAGESFVIDLRYESSEFLGSWSGPFAAA